jgi:hypothetical protein
MRRIIACRRIVMILDIGLVLACHVITTTLALLTTKEPKHRSLAVRLAGIITIAVSLLALADLIWKLAHNIQS